MHCLQKRWVSGHWIIRYCYRGYQVGLNVVGLTHKGMGGETATAFDPFRIAIAIAVNLRLSTNPCPLSRKFRIPLLLPAVGVLAFLGAIWDSSPEVWQAVLVLLLQGVFLVFVFLLLLGEELMCGRVESVVRIEGLTKVRLGDVWEVHLELGLQHAPVPVSRWDTTC